MASSAELRKDRDLFGDFVSHLNNHYRRRGLFLQLDKWEYFDKTKAFDNHRTQDEYNKHVCNCDAFVCLFHTKAGEFTQEEFKLASDECCSRGLPLFIYFRRLTLWDKIKGVSESLDEFKKTCIESELQYFWGEYETNDKLHLDFVLWLDSYLFDGQSELKTENGNVVLGDVIVAKMSQLPFAANNEDFKKLSKTIWDYPGKIDKLRKRTEKYPDEQDFRDELQQALDDYNKAIDEFARYQQTLLDTAKFIADRRMAQTDKKLQRAMDAFEAGDMAGANTILKEIDIEAEEFNKSFENDRNQMHKYIEAFQLQAKTVMAEVEKPIKERRSLVADIYAKADDWANRSAYDPKKYAKLLFDYASFLDDYAYYEDAETIFLRQIALSEKVYGSDSTNTASSYNDIGVVFYHRSEYNKALEYYMKALHVFKNVHGDNHPDTSLIYNNIGMLYNKQNDYPKALDYLLKDLAISENVLGANNPNTATSYNNIGSVYKNQGKYSKALEYFFIALKIYKKELDNNHPSIAKSYNNIGEAYYGQNEYKEALEYHRKALKIRETVLGVDHPDTAISYNNIGMVYKSQGNYDKALEFTNRALEIYEQKLGHDHVLTLKMRENIEKVKEAMRMVNS